MEASRATSESANGPFDARTKRRLVGCALAVPFLVFVWVGASIWSKDDPVDFYYSGVDFERFELLGANGELLRSLPDLEGSLGYIIGLNEREANAHVLRVVHAGGSFDVDVSDVFAPTLFLRIEVVVESLTPSGVTVTSYVDRRQMLRELTPW